MTTDELAKIPLTDQLATMINDSHLAPALVGQITEAFAPHYQQAAKVLDEAADAAVTDPSDLRGMKKAKELRKTLVGMRGIVEKKRVAMTADALKIKSTIDLVARRFREEVEPCEEWLEAQEKLAERMQAEREEKLKADRGAQLEALNVDPAFYQLGTMPEPQFQQLLKSSQAAFEEAQAEAARAEQARLDAEQEAANERARLAAENERLKKEKAEADSKAAEERRAAAAEKSRLEAERNAADLKARHEQDRVAKEYEDKARADREAAAAKEAQQQAETKAAKSKADAEANRLKKLADEKVAAAAKAKKAAEDSAEELRSALGLMLEGAFENKDGGLTIQLTKDDALLVRATFKKAGGAL